MKIGLYSPYAVSTLGGGERYLLTIASCLLSRHQVDLILPCVPKNLKAKFCQNFNLQLDRLNLVAGPFGKTGTAWERFKFTRQYDAFYYMTDGSFFISGAKRNIVHFMVPFNRPPSLIQAVKLKTWPVKTTHSHFCRRALERIWKIKIDYVQWGSVAVEDFPVLPKQNLIVSVGRWFSPATGLHCKRQDVLVKAFKTMCDRGLTGWRLVLTGPVDPGQDSLDYLNSVKAAAKGYPVDFHINAGFKKLQADYGRAKIYWHAAGYNQNENVNPQAMEHFGLSTVEAMSAGAVPVVINKGGQKEIVRKGLDGLLWEKQEELIGQTMSLINRNSVREKLALAARKRAGDFSLSKFCRTTNKIFGL